MHSTPPCFRPVFCSPFPHRMLLPHPPTVPPPPPHASATPTACFCHTHLLSPLPHRMLLPHPPTVPPFPPHASATPTYCPPSPTACFYHTHLLSPLPHRMLLPHPPTAWWFVQYPALLTVQFFIACSFKNGRRRPGSFYHLNNINAYLGRQGGGGGFRSKERS